MNLKMEQINELIQKWTVLQYVLPSISLLLATALGIFLWVYSQNKIHFYQKLLRAEDQKVKELEQKESALSGTITSKIIEGRNSVTIHFGQSHISVGIQSLKAGMNLQPFSFIGDRNVTITLKNESILISADFRSLDGKIVAQITDNEWQINPNNYFDRNYDENGLEIIDQDGITKFQIDYTDLYNIRIGGSFISNGSLYAFFPSGQSLFLGLKGRSKEELIRITDSIKTLFLYPSKNNFGKRREIPDVEFTPKLISDFGEDNPKNGNVLIVPDTWELKGINFGGQFINNGESTLKLRIVDYEVYFNNKLQSKGSIEKEILLPSKAKEEWITPQIHFNDAMQSILFSEAKKMNYRFSIKVEYSDISGINKKALNISYSVILTNTGPAYANISKQ
jgi:hypothetical protein